MGNLPTDRMSGFDTSSTPVLNPSLEEELRKINAHFAAKLGSLLKDTLAQDFIVSSRTMESGTYAGFCSCLPSHTLAAEIHMAPYPSSAIVFIEPSLTFPLVELCAGGGSLFLPQPGGPASGLDRILLESVTVYMLIALRDSWQGFRDLSPRLESLESDLRCVKAFKGPDPVLFSSFELEVNGLRGLLSLCLPLDLLAGGDAYGDFEKGCSLIILEGALSLVIGGTIRLLLL